MIAHFQSLRLGVAVSLGIAAVAGAMVALVASGIAGIHWSHQGGVTAAPLFLVAGAIAAVGIASGATGRQGVLRVVAVLAFTAWGLSQLFSGSAASGPLDDVAIFLFVLDAGGAAIAEGVSLLRNRQPLEARVES